MFGRNKSYNEESLEAAHPQREGAKNRPTPKRRDQQAARKQPMVVQDRKAAKAKSRSARNEEMALRRQAMLTNDERYLPERDKGPRRKFIRDYVDARRNLSELMLPVMVLVLALSFFRNSTTLLIVTLATYSIMIAVVVDNALLWRGLKRRLVEKFGATAKGDLMYAVMRTFQIRRTRMPRPQVQRGEYPA